MADGLKVHEKLLLAAAALTEEGKKTFSAEDLVVEAWRRDPNTFGLAGHVDDEGRPLYPNSNRVFAEIMGSKPIRAQGLLVKAGTKMFRLTEAGCQRAAALDGIGNGTPGRKAGFSRETAKDLRRLLGARAVEKYLNALEDEITFHDASSFWGITARSSAMEFQGRIGQLEGVLGAASEAAEHQPIVMEHGSKTLSSEDLEMIFELHDFLLKRFETEISYIRRRRDERA